MDTCSVESCDNGGRFRRGLCHKHYQRFKKDKTLHNYSLISKLTLREKLNHYSVVNNITGCLEWVGGITSSGYGIMTINNFSKSAHRVSWVVCNGEIPNDLFVLHKCDNRKCINPDHLFLGTNKDNMDDMRSKGRGNFLRGEKHTSSKITEVVVLKICEMLNHGCTYKYIAGILNTTVATVSHIKHGTSWSWLTNRGIK